MGHVKRLDPMALIMRINHRHYAAECVAFLGLAGRRAPKSLANRALARLLGRGLGAGRMILHKSAGAQVS